jgi:hypothetical protein
MNEVAFPVLGAAFVVLVVLPFFAILTSGAAFVLERSGALRHLNTRYVLFTGSSLLPLAWFLSAGFHQAETQRSVLACLFDHEAAELCFEPVLFTMILALTAVACAGSYLRRARHVPPTNSGTNDGTARRIVQLVLTHPDLSPLAGRVAITDQPGFAIGTFGLIRPRIVIGKAFAGRLTDTMLIGALGHERMHVVSLDPLRYLVLNIALAVNPFGTRLLRSRVACWHVAREAQCDREAVLHGAEPLCLANAIVHAARPSESMMAALGAPNSTALKLRIEMLIAFAERPPLACCHRQSSAFPMAIALLLLTLLLPHHTGTAALDALHTGAEHLLTYLWP